MRIANLKFCIQNRAQRFGFGHNWKPIGNITKLFNLFEFSNQNTSDVVTVGDHRYLMDAINIIRNFPYKVRAKKSK